MCDSVRKELLILAHTFTVLVVQEKGKSQHCPGALPSFRRGSYGRCALQSKVNLKSIKL